MTTVFLTGTVSGYPVDSPVTVLTITRTGYVRGDGVNGGPANAYTIVNYGRVDTAAGTTTNRYTGVYLSHGGVVTNGSDSDETALIEASDSAVSLRGVGGVVQNYGTVISTYADPLFVVGGIYTVGGTVTNGSLLDTAARVEGRYGIAAVDPTGTTTITNFGAVEGLSGGVFDTGTGDITNGAPTSTGALIQGTRAGVWTEGASTIRNFGTVDGLSGSGAYLAGGGVVTNGGAGDQTALIEGYRGVFLPLTVTGTVTNFGTILGVGGSFRQSGVYFGDTGFVTNGSASDRSALISGYGGVAMLSAAGTVVNFATIEGTNTAGGPGNYAVDLYDGGSLTNGAANDRTALVSGYGGFRTYGAGTSTNFGVIAATGSGPDANGVLLGQGANLTNGAATDTGALIEGYTGAQVNGGTLTNFGTILGAGGVAVAFGNTKQELVVEAGSVFDGGVYLDGGILDLASGVGAISVAAGYDVAVSGSMPATTFQNVATLAIGSGAKFSASGNVGFGAGQIVFDRGTLTSAGTISIAGALDTLGNLGGTGTLAATGGDTVLETGTTLTIAHVRESGAATMAIVDDATLAYAGVWTQTAGTLVADPGDRVNFSGVGDSFTGTFSGTGTIALIGGSDTLTNATLSATSQIVSNATVTLAGAIDLTSILTATTPRLIIAAGGATLSGKGTVALSNLATNTIVGADAAAKLTNEDTIKGSGQLGDGGMTLDNAAGALIQGTGAVALIINTGATTTIVNAGTIQAVGAGGVTISSPLDNTGLMVANLGTLAVTGAVTGTGHLNINGGVADLAAGFEEAVFFTGTTGELKLGQSKAYTGEITGFSLTGKTSLDLLDVAFAGTTTAHYSGTTTSGVLTVTEGANTAKITLEGNYLSSTFTLSAAPGGGTLVIDPPRTAAPAHIVGPAPAHQFIAAMAGFGAPAAGSGAMAAEIWRTPPPTLVAVRALA